MTDRVAIIGAGIAGFAAGLACRQLDIEFQLFDAAADPLAGGAAITLWPNALRALSELGIGDLGSGVAANAITQGGIATDWGAVLYQLPLDWMRKQYGCFPVCVRRDVLLLAMYEALSRPKIAHARVQTVLEQTDGVMVEGSHGRFAYDAAVIADGIHSQARHHIHPVQPRPTRYTAWRGMAQGPVVDPATMWEYWGEGVRFGYASISPHATYWFATVNHRLLGGQDASWDVARRLFAGFPAPVRACIAATPDADVLRHRVQDLPPGCPMAQGRMVLMGDAAHAITPNLGFGGALAMEDAATWLYVVRNVGISPAAFRIYAAQRRRRVREMAYATRQFGDVMQWQNKGIAHMRNTVFRIAAPIAGRLLWRRLLGSTGRP
ncbi:monooxygenase FAD-binding protein [Alicyclobacillus hesperidum URH17-3-68]|uniref:Salicylate hydroxylase n=1 Tax=Alicyclobacillus hesperidum TaxID=89784 RepID=A0AA37X1N6_9BACL|nr:FAD-dependent monooxygenase [Alicyclobacillus hesperidum]EJY56685.1 monooxygenase FAD-binding protein [Alicyclobacillus hesperidum URH17-3-68]GLV14271.1 salicylate hydroxylase [Alicyclobacillus hesperidum]